MPEGVHAYPRWKGEWAAAPSFLVVAEQELLRAWRNQWFRPLLILIFGYTVLYLGELATLSDVRGDAVHTMDNFLTLLDLLRWGALGVAAVMAGPSLLEDARRGSLELYLARAVTRTDYLVGKVLAVFGATALAMWLPALLYFVMSFLLFGKHPDAWKLVPLTALGYSLLWGAMVAGLGMGLSAVARSSRAASILLFGVLAVVDTVIANLLALLTRSETLRILSPFAALTEQRSWLFGVEGAAPFPYWWGLVEWGGLTVLGWGLVAWKHPRLPGVE